MLQVVWYNMEYEWEFGFKCGHEVRMHDYCYLIV